LETTAGRRCQLCDGNGFITVSTRMQFGLDLGTVMCARCGFVFTNPMPKREVYERFYTAAYADYYGHIAGHVPQCENQVEPEQIGRWLKALENIRPLQGARVLEVGPGRGRFLWWAQRRGCSVLGVEPSAEFCSVLTKAELPHRQGTLADVISSETGQFDIIAMFHVLEHFYDPNEALERCRELLVNDGLLAVEVPNILKPFRSLDRYFLRYVHPSSFSPTTLKCLLERHRFQQRHVHTGGSDWRTHQSLFIVAQKVLVRPEASTWPMQSSSEVMAALHEYREDWRWRIAPKWYGRAVWLKIRKWVLWPVRLLRRALKHKSRGNDRPLAETSSENVRSEQH